jgi:hypothetical protein
MPYCSHCGQELELVGRIGREEICPRCGGYLHCCLNCRFYSGRAGRCLEPQAEEVRDRERANFCDFFVFAEGQPPEFDASVSARARARFESLFRSRPESGNCPSGEGKG